MLHITNTAEALANNVEHFFVCLELSSQRGGTEYAGKVAGSNEKRSHHHPAFEGRSGCGQRHFF